MEWRRIWHKKTIGMTLLLLFLALFFYAREQYDTGYSYPVSGQNAIRNACRREYRGQEPEKAAQELEKRAEFHSDMAQYLDYREMKREMGSYLDEATREMIAEFAAAHPDVVEAYRADSEAYRTQEESVRAMIYGELAEQYRHVAGYHARVRAIQENAERLNTISIFADSGSFSDKNIRKTAADFKEAQKVETEPGNDEFLTSVFNYKAAYFFALAFGMMVAFNLLSERRKGLWPVVYASPYGRARLALHRLAVLAGSTAVFVLVLYLGLFVLSGMIYGPEWNWWRDIQSVSQFEGITVPVKEPVFLAVYYLSVVGFVGVSVFFVWTVLLASDHRMVSLSVLVLVYGLGYLLYAGIGDQSILVLLRYVNPYYLLCGADMWGGYLNLNVFGRVVNRVVLVGTVAAVAAAGTMSVSVAVMVKKHPVRGKRRTVRFPERAAGGMETIRDFLRGHVMELYKLLVWNRGIGVLLFLGIWGTSGVVEMTLTESRTEQFMNAFYREYSGPVTEETVRYFRSLEKEVRDIREKYKQASAGYRKGTVGREEYRQCRAEYEAAGVKMECCQRIRSQILYAQKAGKTLGYPVWLLNDAGYRRLVGSSGYDMQVTEGLKVLLAVVLVMSGMFSTERKKGMKPLLCSTLNGRGTLAGQKAAAAAVVTLLAMAVVYLPDAVSVCRLFPVDSLGAPLKSLSFMARNSFEGSILLYLVYVYYLRFAMFYAAAMAVGCLSARYSMEGSVCAGMALLVPSVLQAAGIPVLQKFSLAHYSSVCVWQSEGNAGMEAAVWLVCAGVLLLAFKGIRRFWCGEEKTA